MLVTRAQRRNARKDAKLSGLDLALPLVREVAKPVAKWTVDQMANAVKGIASAFRSNGTSRQDIKKIVAPIANQISYGSRAPKFTSANGVVRIDHVEAISNITADAVRITSESFAWLRDIAACYEEWKIKLEICYNPVCPSTTTGQVNMAWDYDPDDATLYTNIGEFFQTEDHCVNAVWAPGLISPKGSGWLKTGVNGTEPRTYSPGVFQYRTSDVTAGFFVIHGLPSISQTKSQVPAISYTSENK